MPTLAWIGKIWISGLLYIGTSHTSCAVGVFTPNEMVIGYDRLFLDDMMSTRCQCDV